MNEILVTEAISQERTCSIEQVLDSNFIDLIRLVPKNPSVRALILKLTGKMPAPECQTFEEIKEWIEMACERRNLPAGRSGPGISIRVEFSESESGLAHYSVRRSGTDQFEIDTDDLIEIVRTAIAAGDGLEGIVGNIAARVDDDAWNRCNPQLDDYGDYDYTDHESRDSADSEIEFSRSQIRQSVLAFLRGRHPELAAEL